MKNYILKTTATMKEYNHKKWWIEPDVVRELHVRAENARDALNQYREIWRKNIISPYLTTQ